MGPHTEKRPSMKKRRRKNIAKIFREATLISKAVREAAVDALRRHKKAGSPVAQWRDGKVVWVQPEDIPDF